MKRFFDNTTFSGIVAAMKRWGVVIAALTAIAACGRSIPHERLDEGALPPGTQVTPGETVAPGETVDADLIRELNDECVRFDLGKTTMRYDRGGILVSRQGDGTVRFVDLDGSGVVSVNVERSMLTIDGKPVGGAEFRLLRTHDGAEWYSLTAGEVGILVIPAG